VHGMPKYRSERRAMAKAGFCAALVAFAVASGAAAAGDAAFGEYLAGECATCHRKDGDVKGIPSIIGWPQDQFVAVMQSFKAKDRPNPIMQTIAGRLSDEELAALAAYYESLKPK
jgi:cytochrome c553